MTVFPPARLTAPVALLLVLLLPAAAAHATTSTVVGIDMTDASDALGAGQRLEFTGLTTGANRLRVSRGAEDQVEITLEGGGALEISPDLLAEPALCSGTPTTVVCHGAPYHELRVDFETGGGDGADQVTLAGPLVRRGDATHRGVVQVKLGAGADRYDGTAMPATTTAAPNDAWYDYGVLSGGASGAGGVWGGDGDDVLIGGAADERIFGGLGRDELRGGGGDDQLHGGDGNDRFIAEAGGDGDDQLFGDGETITPAELEGDIVDYGKRSTAVGVVLPGDDSASTGNGGGGENDQLSDVESVTGGGAGDVLTGNARPNVLTGGAGGDVLDGQAGSDRLDGGFAADAIHGGDGDDVLVARRDPYDPTGDVDAAVDCGGGSDIVATDPGDLPTGCERVAAGFGGPAVVQGTAQVGATVAFSATVFGGDADGNPVAPVIWWYACVPGGGCDRLASGRLLELTAAHAGRTIYATAALTVGFGELTFRDFASTPQTAAVSLPAVIAPPQGPGGTPEAGTPPPPVAVSFADRARGAADRAFGGAAQPVWIPKLGPSRLVYESPLVKRRRFPVDPSSKTNTSLLVVACQQACQVTADLLFTRPPAARATAKGAKRGSGKAAKASSRKLGRSKFRLQAGQAGVFRVKLNKRERQALKQAKTPKQGGTLKVTLGFMWAGDKKVTRTTRTYAVYAAKTTTRTP